MKRLLSFSLALILIATLFCPTMMASATTLNGKLTIAGDNIVAKPGDTVSIQLCIKENPGIAWLAITLAFDSKVFELQNVENGSILKDMDRGVNLVWSDDKNSTKTGVLVTLTFKISDKALDGNYEIGIKGRECYNDDFDDVLLSITNTRITVSAEKGARPFSHGSTENGKLATPNHSAYVQAGTFQDKKAIRLLILTRGEAVGNRFTVSFKKADGSIISEVTRTVGSDAEVFTEVRAADTVFIADKDCTIYGIALYEENEKIEFSTVTLTLETTNGEIYAGTLGYREIFGN